MTISILASLWATSSGIEALREALNQAYGVEEPRSIWFCRLQSLAFTIIFSICIILVMLVLVIGPVLWSYIQPMLEVPWEWGWFYEALRYIVAVALLYLVVALLYRWLPSRHLPLGRSCRAPRSPWSCGWRSRACSPAICRTSAASP